MNRPSLSPHGRPFRVVTGRAMGDPDPTLARRRAEADERARIGTNLLQGHGPRPGVFLAGR